jgi:hypothetical protein
MSTLIPDAPVVPCTTRYRVTFERIGRVQAVAPLEVDAATADWLAQTIHAAAARQLPTRTFEVVLDVGAGRGYLLAGGRRNAGSFTVEVIG